MADTQAHVTSIVRRVALPVLQDLEVDAQPS